MISNIQLQYDKRRDYQHYKNLPPFHINHLLFIDELHTITIYYAMYLVHCTIDELEGITIRQVEIFRFTPACFSKFKPGINLQPLIVSLQGQPDQKITMESNNKKYKLQL